MERWLQTLRDAPWGSDTLRSEYLPSGGSVTDGLIFTVVQAIVPKGLRMAGLDKHAIACENAETINDLAWAAFYANLAVSDTGRMARGIYDGSLEINEAISKAIHRACNAKIDELIERNERREIYEGPLKGENDFYARSLKRQGVKLHEAAMQGIQNLMLQAKEGVDGMPALMVSITNAFVACKEDSSLEVKRNALAMSIKEMACALGPDILVEACQIIKEYK